MSTLSKFTNSSRAVLYGLQIIMERDIGISKPIASSTLFVEHLRDAGIWEELDLADLFSAIDKFFEVKIPWPEWTLLLGGAHRERAEWEANIAARLTFGHIAQFIAARLPITRIPTLRILGKRCLQAGAFHTIEHFVERIDPDDLQFGPSTPIHHRLRGSKLKRVWSQLSWLSEGRLPSLRTPPSEAARNWLMGKMWLAFCIALIAKFLFWLNETRFTEFLGISTLVALSIAGIVLGVSLLVFALSPILNRVEPRLPSGFRTFRDLAVALAPAEEPV
ncbi:MAG: hypothetical protein IPK83_10635 [Planctomycetes bacterium]|nr:hypothetical protein [Planctomycetota bacterium]